MKKLLVAFTSLALLITLGCSSLEEGASGASVPQGSLLISRPLPHPISVTTPHSMLGFHPPALENPPGNWLKITRNNGTISLMHGAETDLTASADGINTLQPGEYTLVHKQRAPLWYAPKEYFAARNLPLPPENDRERFRRGALGDFVLYFDRETPIHSGPIWSKDIGGIRVGEQQLSKIYYLLQLGAVVRVD